MQLTLLHLDDSLKQQPTFLEACRLFGATEIEANNDGAQLRLWAGEDSLKQFGQRLLTAMPFSAPQQPLVTFLGSGDFHHITPLLLICALRGHHRPVTVLHFDNHPDWVKFSGGSHCGSWVNQVFAIPQVTKVITLGVCSNDLVRPELKSANLQELRAGRLELFPWYHPPSWVWGNYGKGRSYVQRGRRIYWHNLWDLATDNFMGQLLDHLTTQVVYITIDKDVLTQEYALTNWNQGMMTLDFLLDALRHIAHRADILGIDVVGDYSLPHYAGSWFLKLLKRSEIWLDQPRCLSSLADAAQCNSATNQALLTLFRELLT